MRNDTILVFNFGGQYCHLIGRRVRDSGVYSEVVQADISIEEIRKLGRKFNIKGIILSGGPASIYDRDAPRMEKAVLKLGLPILGICYGHQLLASYLEGKVVRAEKQEYGSTYALITKPEGVLKGLSRKEEIWMSHGDTVLSLPKGIETTARTSNCPIASFMHKTAPIFGVQWHPEVVHTRHGARILSNFIFGVCRCERTWDAEKTAIGYIDEIRREVGREKAIIAMSGGVDSSTAAVLASKTLGRRLTAVFVDTGLMRQDEPSKIREMARRLKVNLVQVDASKEFLGALEGVSDPEEKRRIIGREFIRTFEREAKKTNAKYLIQGTIYPDRIESGHSKKASVIKTHHNVGGIPTDIKFKGVIDPLRDLYKDEVRRLAAKLGMPREMIHRQPFPGPGLAVRVMGEVTGDKLRILRKAEAIVSEELEKATAGRRPWQYFAVLTSTMSTGVKGDSRAYGHVIAIRAVDSKEAMTAGFSKVPYETLETISTRITSEVPEVVRVVYDITNKPPATIEWE
ncbi:MAG TPA: glutamine-hydrolyzing GMP synthase [Candidatus Saccharimonadales bacterium]|nr:glutamine-hydrolyzing GMP synthase [Candidatus Saccharimonadales bacterium]